MECAARDDPPERGQGHARALPPGTLMAAESSNPPARKFPNAMLGEIYEQPRSIRETIRQNVDGDIIFGKSLHPIENALFAFKKIIIAASGSSRHAGLAGEIMMEDL